MKIFALMAAAAALGGCNVAHMFHDGPQVKGSGKAKSEARKVGGFSNVVVAGAADCKVTVGPALSVEVKADDNVLPLIETKVVDGTLIIESKGNYSTQIGVQVTIKIPNLDSFKVRGAGNTDISGIKGKAFAAEISGAGDMKATGQTDKLSLSIRGSGNMDFYNLKSRNADASISGSGDIKLYVMGNLDASIRGSGNISYAGKPDHVNKSISGSGDIDER